MKKDIQVQPVKDIELAIIREYNPTADVNEWHAYVINNKTVDIEMLIMVSKGYSETQKTATMRRQLDLLPSMSSAKMEYIPEDLFDLENQFQVSFFEGGKIHEITFILEKGSISSEALQKISYINKMGIYASVLLQK